MSINETKNLFGSEEWENLSRAYQASAEAYNLECDEYWNSLSYEDQLKAFYSVSKRIYKGEIEDKGSYRWVLYDVFNFSADAYAIGMECGYMEIHNAIVDLDDLQALRKENADLKKKLVTEK